MATYKPISFEKAHEIMEEIVIKFDDMDVRDIIIILGQLNMMITKHIKYIEDKITFIKAMNECNDKIIGILVEWKGITMTKDLLAQIKDGIWNEESIRNRAIDLANIAYDKVWKI